MHKKVVWNLFTIFKQNKRSACLCFNLFTLCSYLQVSLWCAVLCIPIFTATNFQKIILSCLTATNWSTIVYTFTEFWSQRSRPYALYVSQPETALSLLLHAWMYKAFSTRKIRQMEWQYHLHSYSFNSTHRSAWQTDKLVTKWGAKNFNEKCCWLKSFQIFDPTASLMTTWSDSTLTHDRECDYQKIYFLTQICMPTFK